MSCFMSTGNMCDIVYDYVYPEGYDRPGIQVLKGIRPRNGELIPLPQAQDFINCLQQILDECKRSQAEYELSQVRRSTKLGSKDKDLGHSSRQR